MRIRSIHPEQWIDDDFLSMTPLARLLSLALRNLADDGGNFEWKPNVIKRQVLPDDDADVDDLLSELMLAKQIIPYSVKGRKYGHIRNFERFQSPQRPSYKHPKFHEGSMSDPVHVQDHSYTDRGSLHEGSMSDPVHVRDHSYTDRGSLHEGSMSDPVHVQDGVGKGKGKGEGEGKGKGEILKSTCVDSIPFSELVPILTGQASATPPHNTPEPCQKSPTRDEEAPEEGNTPADTQKSPTAILAAEIFEAWNTMAKSAGLPKARAFDEKRMTALRARLKEPSFLEAWRDAIDEIPKSRFLTGHNDRAWRASLNFLLKPGRAVAIAEGTYSGDRRPAPGNFLQDDDDPFAPWTSEPEPAQDTTTEGDVLC